MTPGLSDAALTLREREKWLTARIAAKVSVGWEVTWDTRERDALRTVLAALAVGEPSALQVGG